MSKPPDNFAQLSDTLTLCEFKTGGSKGFWLYDETRGMNLAMRAGTETAAFVEALTYYQDRLNQVEGQLTAMATKVNAFIGQFTDSDDE